MSDITNRLRELAHAVADQRWSEFSMRVPADRGRDADLVLMRAADEITQLRAENASLIAAAPELVEALRMVVAADTAEDWSRAVDYARKALALELVEALRTARDYVFCELETERQQMKGYERISRIDEIAADLAEIDAALAKAGVG